MHSERVKKVTVKPSYADALQTLAESRTYLTGIEYGGAALVVSKMFNVTVTDVLVAVEGFMLD